MSAAREAARLPRPAAGETYATSGRARLTLPADTALVIVEAGEVDLFLDLPAGDGRPVALRRQIGAYGEGAALPLPAGLLAPGAGLTVRGVGEARVRLLGRAERATWFAPEHGAALAAGLAALLDALPGGADTAGYRLAPDENFVATHPLVVGAASPLWIALGEGAGVARLSLVGRGLRHPLGAGDRVDAIDAAAAVARFGWEAVDGVLAEVLGRLADDLAGTAAARAGRIARRDAHEAEGFDAALGRLAGILGRASDAPPVAARPARAAVAVVCAARRIDAPLAGGDEPASSAAAEVETLLRRSNLRGRTIALERGWWGREGSSAVGFDRTTGAPLAIVRRGPRHYTLTDPADGTTRRIDAAVAARLTEDAIEIYRPLPFRPIGARDLVRLVLATPARSDLRWAMLLALATALVGLLTPIITGRLLDAVIPFAEVGTLVQFALGLAVLAVGSGMFQFVRSIALLRVEAFADGALQAAVWDRLLRLPLSFFRRFEIGDILIKATAPTQLRQTISAMALSAGLGAVFSAVNLGLMLWYAPQMALAALGFTVGSGVVLTGLAWLQLRFERTRLVADGRVTSFLVQMLNGVQKVRLTGAERRAFTRWADRFADQRSEAVRAGRVANVAATLNPVLPLLASILIFWLVADRDEALSVGTFVAFNMAFGQFNAAVLSLFGAVSSSLAALPLFETMKPLLEETPEIDMARRPPPALSGAIDLSGITFRYHPDAPAALSDVTLSVAAGEFVAVVGPSGSGKSTLMRLLLGFETPEIGTIGFDGHDMAQLDLRALRRQMGVVLQRGTVLPGTLFENIVGNASLTLADAWEAARMAGLDEDIRQMPMGMQTLLSEGGTTISGGQRQRLMIARAIVRRPRILLMDEATSALDNRTQAIVAASLAHLDATRIVIAHRLSTIVDADRIVVLVDGGIVETGTYAELMARRGAFHAIAARQLTRAGEEV